MQRWMVASFVPPSAATELLTTLQSNFVGLYGGLKQGICENSFSVK